MEKTNLRGPSKIVLESFVCDICGKKRNAGKGKWSHDKCSKLKQKLYRGADNGNQ